LAQAHEHGMTDECMADVQLGYIRLSGNQGCAADMIGLPGLALRQGQTMTGVGAQPQAAC